MGPIGHASVGRAWQTEGTRPAHTSSPPPADQLSAPPLTGSQSLGISSCAWLSPNPGWAWLVPQRTKAEESQSLMVFHKGPYRQHSKMSNHSQISRDSKTTLQKDLYGKYTLKD